MGNKQVLMDELLKEARELSPKTIVVEKDVKDRWLRLAKYGPKGTPARVTRQMVFRTILKEAGQNGRQRDTE